MNDFIQEHKKFLVTHVVGALVFLIMWLIVGALFNDDIASNRRQTKSKNRQAAKGLPRGVRLQDVKAGKDKQDDSFRDLQASVARVPDGDFTLEGVQDPDVHYNHVTQSIRDSAMEACLIRNVEFLEPAEELGRPTKFPATPDDFAWYLRGLEVVQQVLEILVRSAEEVLPEGIARIERIQIKSSPRRRGLARRRFVTAHGVEFTIVGHPANIAFLLEEISRKRQGRMLVVETARLRSLDLAPGLERRTKRQDPLDRGRVEARIEVSSTDVDPGGVVERKRKGSR